MLRNAIGAYLNFTRPQFSGVGGSTSTTTVNVPGPTPAEISAQNIALRRMRRQEALELEFPDFNRQQIESSMTFMEDFESERQARLDAGITPQLNAEIEMEQIERARRMGGIEEELANVQLEAIRRGGQATPEQLEAINAATGAAQATGEADIERFRTETLRQINEEVASASGLRPTDTPVVRLSERAGEESTRQQGMLTSRLAETNAMARLNFPLASQKLQSDMAGQQQGLMLASQQFRESLGQRAQDNRFRLFQGTSTNQNQASRADSPAQFSLGLGNQRMQQRSTFTENTAEPTWRDIASIASSVGGMMAMSDRRLKRDIFCIGQLGSGLPVYLYRFNDSEDWHVGVMADEVQEIIPEAVAEHESGYQMVAYHKLH